MAGLPFVSNEADSKRLTGGMESHGGGNQLCKNILHARIQQESSPESVLVVAWFDWFERKSSVRCHPTELGSGHLS